jgi:hypothetical protein
MGGKAAKPVTPIGFPERAPDTSIVAQFIDASTARNNRGII